MLQGERSVPLGGSGGLPPDTPRVTFVVKRKSPGARGGAPAGRCRGYQPRINSRGAEHGFAMLSQSARIRGGVQRRALALLAKGECRGAKPLCTPLDFWRAIEYTIIDS